MTETKTYVFPEQGGGGGNAAAWSAAMMNNSLLPMMGMMNGCNGGFGGGAMWNNPIWAIVFLAALQNGGLFGNRNGTAQGIENANQLSAIREQLQDNQNSTLLMDAIKGSQDATRQLANSLNCDINAVTAAINSVQSSICNVGGKVDMSAMQTIEAINRGNQSLASQLSSCCCDVREAVTQGNYQNQLATVNQTNTLQNTCNANAQSLRDATATQTNAIIAKLDQIQTSALQDKIAALQEKNSVLLSQLSNEHQTANISAIVAQAVNPVNALITSLQKEVTEIKSAQPTTATIPYSPVVGVPSCVAAQMGYYGNIYNSAGGFL